jgi:hypothetical protein
MLTQSIDQTRAAMQQVAAIGQLPPAADPLRNRASTFNADVIPKLQQMQKDTSAFVVSTKGVVKDLLAGVEQNSLVDMRWKVGTFAPEARAIKERVAAMHSILSGYRQGFAVDQAALQTARIELDSQLRGLVAMREHWQQELQQRGTQMTVENVLMWIFPIAKLASEVVSLIKNQNTTEGALAEAGRKVEEGQQQHAALVQMIARVGEAEGHAMQLTNAVQYVDNMVSVVCGKLENQAAFFDAADRGAVKLFLFALVAGFEQLEAALA